jgi:uncharacterized membrane protein YhaH (DUF805 family)
VLPVPPKSSHSLTFALAVLWTLPAPLIIVVSARHLGARLRDQEDRGHSWSTRDEGLRAAMRRAPVSALALILSTVVTVLLAMMTASRFYGDASAQGTLGLGMRVTAVAFGLLFVAIPAFAVAVHAMHDPSHRKDMIRLTRKGIQLESAHRNAWRALLAVAQDIMTEIGYTQHVVDEHMAVRRVGDKDMGAHPPRRVDIGTTATTGTAGDGPFSRLLSQAGEIPQGMVNSDPLSYNWTGLYKIFTALELHPLPDRTTPGRPPCRRYSFVDLWALKRGAPTPPPAPNGGSGTTLDPV